MAILCLVGAFYNLRRKRIIDDLPTSKTQGVFIGLSELKGTAESESPLTSYLAKVQCVQYAWQIYEHWQRTTTETYSDAQGHTKTRTKTRSGWTRVAHGGESEPFYLKDDTGVIRIVPKGAQIQANSTFKETVKPSNPLYYGKGPANAVANSTHRRRFQETAVPLHTMLYVVGQARQREDVVAAEIAQDKASPMFLISIRSEKQISTGYGRWSWFFMVLGLIAAIWGGATWAEQIRTGPEFGWLPFAIMIMGYIVVLLLTWVWTTYNSLINLHHRVEQGWSQVEVQLKRRYNLIPNLVQVVEAYMKHESGTQMTLVDLRGQMEALPTGAALPDFRGLAPLLRVTIERYPDLKANESFLKLQQSLVDTEQRIALARDYFNDVATFYNNRLQIVPDRYIASLAKLHPQTLMSAAEFERAPVEVKLVS